MATGTIGYSDDYPDPNSEAYKKNKSELDADKERYWSEGENDWAELYKKYGKEKILGGTSPSTLDDQTGLGAEIRDWTQKKTKDNLGWSTPEQAWKAGMLEGPDAWAQAEADAWGAQEAPEMWNAGGQRDTRAGALDALRGATRGGLSSDIQARARREAALMSAASAGRRNYNPYTGQTSAGGQSELASSQSALANTGMQEAIKERAARAAALGEGLQSGRAQELAEAQRMQDWTVKREALRQKMLGMGLSAKNRRFDLLAQYIRGKEAQTVAELNMAQQANAAAAARNSTYLTTGGQVGSKLLEGLKGDSGSGGGGDGGSDEAFDWGTDDEDNGFDWGTDDEAGW